MKDNRIVVGGLLQAKLARVGFKIRPADFQADGFSTETLLAQSVSHLFAEMP